MFIPAATSLPIISGESVAGPSVAIIFVFRMGSNNCANDKECSLD
jgi:hypothetical protein